MIYFDTYYYIRKSKKLSQSKIGKLIDINSNTYGRYERNKVKSMIEIDTESFFGLLT